LANRSLAFSGIRRHKRWGWVSGLVPWDSLTGRSQQIKPASSRPAISQQNRRNANCGLHGVQYPGSRHGILCIIRRRGCLHRPLVAAPARPIELLTSSPPSESSLPASRSSFPGTELEPNISALDQHGGSADIVVTYGHPIIRPRNKLDPSAGLLQPASADPCSRGDGHARSVA